VVAAGLALAIVLALLDAVRITSHGVALRRQPTYLSYSRIFVTQKGFPWGRLGSTTQSAAAVAGADRLTGLAAVYSQLVTTDPVRALMNREKPPVGTLEAAPVLDPVDSSASLPIISIAAYSSTPQKAMRLARAATDALVSYVGAQQAQNDIPESDRVQLQVVMRAEHAQLAKSPSPAMPIVIFLAVLLATVGLVFVLENLGVAPVVPPAVEAARRWVRSAA
jgi:capsular polysaccharide biosynthesis protein